MFAIVARFSGPLHHVLLNAAAVFAHVAGFTPSSQGYEGNVYVLRGVASSADAAANGLAGVASMPAVTATATSEALPADVTPEPVTLDAPPPVVAQPVEEAAAAIAEAEANVEAFLTPGAGAPAELDLSEPPLVVVEATVETVEPVETTTPDLGRTEPFTIALTGAGASVLVEQGQVIGQALTGMVNFASIPTGWCDGAWCLYGHTALTQESLHAIACNAAPSVSVLTRVG